MELHQKLTNKRKKKKKMITNTPQSVQLLISEGSPQDSRGKKLSYCCYKTKTATTGWSKTRYPSFNFFSINSANVHLF